MNRGDYVSLPLAWFELRWHHKGNMKFEMSIREIFKPYILKAKKFVEPPFQLKKIAEKVRKSGCHFWAILGNFGPFWVFLGYFGPFWVILGPFGVIFGPLWAILGNFWPFLGHFMAFLDKFAEKGQFFLRDFKSHNPRF